MRERDRMNKIILYVFLCIDFLWLWKLNICSKTEICVLPALCLRWILSHPQLRPSSSGWWRSTTPPSTHTFWTWRSVRANTSRDSSLNCRPTCSTQGRPTTSESMLLAHSPASSLYAKLSMSWLKLSAFISFTQRKTLIVNGIQIF